MSFLPPYISARFSMRLVGALLIALAGISWASVGVDWALLQLADQIRSGAEVTRAQRLAHLHSVGGLGELQLLVALVTGGLFVTWLYQVRVNVRALGARRLRWRREWTVLAFLIPGLNAVRPYQVLREIWQASDPHSDAFGWRELPVSPLLAGWWGSLLGFALLELLAWTVLLGVDTAGERRLAYSARIISDLCAAASASLGYFVVTRITDAQDEKHAQQTRQRAAAHDPIRQSGDALAS